MQQSVFRPLKNVKFVNYELGKEAKLWYYSAMNYQIGNKLKQLNSMLSEVDNIYQSLLKANNVSESEYIVMFAINELGEGCSQKDISENGYASKKTINSTIKKFEKRRSY